MSEIEYVPKKCIRPGCNNESKNLKCSKCGELGITQRDRYCSRKCFSQDYSRHKLKYQGHDESRPAKSEETPKSTPKSTPIGTCSILDCNNPIY